MDFKYAIQFIGKRKIKGTKGYLKSADSSNIWYLQSTILYLYWTLSHATWIVTLHSRSFHI